MRKGRGTIRLRHWKEWGLWRWKISSAAMEIRSTFGNAQVCVCICIKLLSATEEGYSIWLTIWMHWWLIPFIDPLSHGGIENSNYIIAK